MSISSSACTAGADFKLYRLESELARHDYAHITFDRSGNRGRGSCTLKMSDAVRHTRIKDEVLNAGGNWPLHDAEGAEISDLNDYLPDAAGLLAQTTGWKGDGSGRWFCLPDQVIGNIQRPTFLDPPIAGRSLARTSQGTLETWKEAVAEPASGSAIAMLSMLCGFASPLFPFSSVREGFILNIAGDGSSGKSTANRAAASVWGNPDHIASWNSTPTALAEIAGANSHLLLVLDDAEQASLNPEKRIRAVQGLTHLLTSGQTRLYSKTVSGRDQLAQHAFETIILSSSPFGVEAHMQVQGVDRTDGDRARLLELVIPPGQKAGIWASIAEDDDPEDTAALSDVLNNGARRNFGVAGPRFVAFLCDHAKELEGDVERYRKKFRKVAARDLTNVEGRIADKVALLFAAGRLAIEADILPWEKPHLKAVTLWGLKSILAASRTSKFDAASVTMGLRGIVFDQKCFPRCKATKLAEYDLPEDCVGVVHEPGKRIYANMDSLVSEIGRRTARILSNSQKKAFMTFLTQNGLLLPGDNGGFTKTIRLLNDRKHRLLVFEGTKLMAFFKENKDQ